VDPFLPVVQAIKRHTTTHRLGEHEPCHPTQLVPGFLISRAGRIVVIPSLGIAVTVQRDSPRVLSSIEETDDARYFMRFWERNPSKRHCLLPVGASSMFGLGRSR
jgi:hypothetical protein